MSIPLPRQTVNWHTNAIIPSFADEILYRFVIYEETGGTGVRVGSGLTRPKVSARATFAPSERDSCGPECGIFDRLPSWQIEDKATETGCVTESTSHSVGSTYIRPLLTRLMSVSRALGSTDTYRQVIIRLGCHFPEVLIILPLVYDHCEMPL